MRHQIGSSAWLGGFEENIKNNLCVVQVSPSPWCKVSDSHCQISLSVGLSMPDRDFTSACGIVRHKGKTGKTVGVWLLVFGCRFLVNNACLMEDSQESRLINPKPITHNLQPAPTVFPVFSFDVLVSVCAQRTESRSVTETYGDAGCIQIRKMRSSFQRKDIKRGFYCFLLSEG